MRKHLILIAAIPVALTATAAIAGSLAAPGDCAQAIRNLDTGPVSAQPIAPTSRGSASGAPIDHFAPISVVNDAVARTPNVVDAIVGLIARPSATAAGGDVQPTSLSVDAGTLQVNTGTLPVNTGSLPLNTGSLQVNTNSLPVETGSLPIDTGSAALTVNTQTPSAQIAVTPPTVVPLPSMPVVNAVTAPVVTTVTTNPVTTTVVPALTNTLGGRR